MAGFDFKQINSIKFKITLPRSVLSNLINLLTNNSQVHKVPDGRSGWNLTFVNAWEKQHKAPNVSTKVKPQSTNRALTWIFSLSISYPQSPLFCMRRMHCLKSVGREKFLCNSFANWKKQLKNFEPTFGHLCTYIAPQSVSEYLCAAPTIPVRVKKGWKYDQNKFAWLRRGETKISLISFFYTRFVIRIQIFHYKSWHSD